MPEIRNEVSKMNIRGQLNLMRVPKEAVDVYVKLEENKIYWVGKNDVTGSIDIW